MDSKHCTANGVFKYDHPFNTIPLKDWVQSVNNHMSCVYNWKVIPLQPGAFGFDNMCMSIGRLFQNLTFDVEEASDIVHKAWIENYTFWIANEPWHNGYRKPKKPIGDERRNRCATTQYSALPDEEKDKDRIIARYIINNHLNYQQFVNTFIPQNIEELEDKTLIFPHSKDPFAIHPTIVVNDSDRNCLKKTIEMYKESSGNNHIYEFKGNKHKLYLGPTSQVALTSKYAYRQPGARGVVISIDEVNGEELPLVRFVDGEEHHIGYVAGAIPLMMATFITLSSDINFELEMCIVDGECIEANDVGLALRKARTFDCVEVRNLPSWSPATVLDLISDPGWKAVLVDAFEHKSDFLKKFTSWIWSEYDHGPVYPPKNQIFTALNEASFDDIKVVIIGQDPYHTPQKAHGLSFSVRDGIQPYLRNIYAELNRTGFTTPPNSGNLVKWAKQGVLLLNVVLTVCAGKANSHAGKGWEQITDEIIKQISMRKDNVVFMLWGAFAQKKCTFIDVNRHCVLRAVHPSPMTTGYVGCNCFCDTNNYLKKKGYKEIDWNLT